MPKKKPLSSPSPKSRPKRASPRRGPVRWLLLIDNEPLHRAAIGEYHALEERIRLEREKMEAFQGGDLPAYQRWEAHAFGPLLTELRTVMQDLEHKRVLLGEIEEESFWSGCSLVTAYRRVMERIKAAEAAQAAGPRTGAREAEEDFESEESDGGRVFGDRDLPEDFDIEEYDGWSKRKQRDFRESYEAIAEMYELVTGRRAPDLDGLLEHERAKREGSIPRGESRREHGAAPARESQRADEKPSRLKELYRTLVRQLHPDTGGKQTARERELWHEVQEAYKAGDVERLEAVAGRVEIGLKGSAVKLPLQVLRRMTRDLARALKSLRSQLGGFRKHPAWEFRKKAAELPKLEKRRRRSLTQSLDVAKEELGDLNYRLESLEKQAAGSGRSSKKKRRMIVDDYGELF